MRGESASYQSPEARYLETKDDSTLRALLNGIRTREEAQAWISSINKRGLSDWRKEMVVDWIERNNG